MLTGFLTTEIVTCMKQCEHSGKLGM